MPRSRATRSSGPMPGMMSGPTPIGRGATPPRMPSSTPRMAPQPQSKVQSTPFKGGLAPPAAKGLARPKTPKVPLPSQANQGPAASTNKATNRSIRAFGKQQRRVRKALGAQAGNPQQRAGLPAQPMAGNAFGAMPQTPDSASIAGAEDATY